MAKAKFLYGYSDSDQIVLMVSHIPTTKWHPLYYGILLIFLLLPHANKITAQDAYWIYFNHLSDTSKLTDDYELLGTSEWLTSGLVLSSKNYSAIRADFPDVKRIVPAVLKSKANQIVPSIKTHENWETILNNQLKYFNITEYKKQKRRGKGICIAVFDGGFPGVDTHPAFAHLHEGNQIIGTWNFPRADSNVFRDNPHGTAVLSCIAGLYEDHPTGLATEASFLLARTELNNEPWIEQLYWIKAAEWAHQQGANIICSSLGYTKEHYFREEMNGQSPVAEAARIATQKGILVINSIGNDGQNKWELPGTPADAAEVLSVGAIDPKAGIKANYSSVGPNAVGQLKPNVVAPGEVLAATQKTWKVMYGTSFAAPLIAGFAACLWEQHPGFNNVDVFNLIQQMSALYPYYDYAHGYGVPAFAPMGNSDTESKTNSISITQNQIGISLKIINIQNKQTPKQLYFHLADQDDFLLEYQVVEIYEDQSISISNDRLSQARKIRIYCDGEYREMKLNQ